MAPLKPEADESASDPTVAASTHHNSLLLTMIEEEEEGVDATSTTHHESLLIQEKRVKDVVSSSEKEQVSARADDNDDDDDEAAIPLEVREMAVELALQAYERALKRSAVLSRSKIADAFIARVGFDEIRIDKFLGKGSFSTVHEITKISCADCDEGEGDDDDDDDNRRWDPPERGGSTLESRANDARKILTMNHKRPESGTYRYAVKFLKKGVRSTPMKYVVGTVDLVLEAMFLASLSHPNIIKVRGLPEGGVRRLVRVGGNGSNGYFLVLDRLFDTLSDRIYGGWKNGHCLEVKKRFGFLSNKKGMRERNAHLAVRLKVAFDVSAALKYLHSKRIIYRDLKPENLGFDVRGDIKLFDLGLVRELHPWEEDKDGNYRFSMAGTPRYMAPECGMYQPYNLSADVYSFSMLLWEILTLAKPLKDYTYDGLKKEVFYKGVRPPIGNVFNKKMRNLIGAGWCEDPGSRPSMDTVYDELKEEYLKLAPGNLTEAEVSHNRRRSTFFLRRLTTM